MTTPPDFTTEATGRNCLICRGMGYTVHIHTQTLMDGSQYEVRKYSPCPACARTSTGPPTHLPDIRKTTGRV